MTAEPAAEPEVEAATEAEVAPLRRNRDFMLLWTGAGFAQLGAKMSVIAFPLLLIWHNGTTLGAGLVAFAGLLPTLLLQLPAGVLVDRWDRRKVMIACDIVAATSMASVAVLLLFGVVWLPHLFLVNFLEGSCMIFYLLSERAAVRNVVAPQHISSAISQNEARGRAAGLLGQPAGSGLFALLCERATDLTEEQETTLRQAMHDVLDGALRHYEDVVHLPIPDKLPLPLQVHRHQGEPCPRCGTTLEAVHYEDYVMTYCPHDQTGDKVLKDRRLSRLLK